MHIKICLLTLAHKAPQGNLPTSHGSRAGLISAVKYCLKLGHVQQLWLTSDILHNNVSAEMFERFDTTHISASL